MARRGGDGLPYAAGSGRAAGSVRPLQEDLVGRRRGSGAVVAWLLVVTAAVGCVDTGSASTTIDAAELEIEQLADRITEAIDLEVTREQPLRARTRCQLPTGVGASNALSRRGPMPSVDDPLGRSAAIVLEAGYQLVDTPEIGEGIFGRRDGIRITVLVDAPTDQLVLDANTGCRLLPR